MVLRLDHRVLGELDGLCPSCGEERSLRRHSVRPAWLAAAILFPNPELLVCERCSGVSRQESVLDRAIGALLLVSFLLVLVGGGATGAWILWGLLATGRPDWGFLALGAGLVAVAALAGQRTARGLANLLGPRRMLPMAGLSVDLGAAPRGSPHRADAWLTPHPALSLFWTAVAPAALPDLFAVVASASEGSATPRSASWRRGRVPPASGRGSPIGSAARASAPSPSSGSPGCGRRGTSTWWGCLPTRASRSAPERPSRPSVGRCRPRMRASAGADHRGSEHGEARGKDLLVTAATDGGSADMSGALEALQEWYSGQCDGDWEHSFGVKLETVDNPGWVLSVDLAETPWADLQIPFTRVERSEEDWIDFRAKDSVFTATGGTRNLTELVRVFLDRVGATRRP